MRTLRHTRPYRYTITTMMLMVALTLSLTTWPEARADDKKKPPVQHDPAATTLTPTPQPMLKTPSPGNSEAGSPVRGYIYGPPPDSGSITDRLIPPSTVRR